MTRKSLSCRQMVAAVLDPSQPSQRRFRWLVHEERETTSIVVLAISLVGGRCRGSVLLKSIGGTPSLRSLTRNVRPTLHPSSLKPLSQRDSCICVSKALLNRQDSQSCKTISPNNQHCRRTFRPPGRRFAPPSLRRHCRRLRTIFPLSTKWRPSCLLVLHLVISPLPSQSIDHIGPSGALPGFHCTAATRCQVSFGSARGRTSYH